MTDKRLEEIRKRVEAATPGPWVPSDHDWGSNDGVYVPEPNEGVCTVHNHGVRSWSCFVAVPANNHACEIGSEAHRNMVFIAHARSDIPFLLDEVARLRKQVEIAMGALDGIDSMSMCWSLAPDPRELARTIYMRAGEALVQVEAIGKGGGDGLREGTPEV